MEAQSKGCLCGNFEEATVGKELKNRAEVPGSMEFRTLLTIAAKKGWSIGGLDVKTAFLYAPLVEKKRWSHPCPTSVTAGEAWSCSTRYPVEIAEVPVWTEVCSKEME